MAFRGSVRLMKRILKSLIIFGLAAVFGAGCATTGGGNSASDFESSEPITADSVTLIVHGMGCPLCANNVDRQLLALNGVRSVNANLGSGEVKAVLWGPVRPTPRELARAIRDSGFTLREIRIP